MTPRAKELVAKIERDLERDRRSLKIVDDMKRASNNPFNPMTEPDPIDATIETCLTAERVLGSYCDKLDRQNQYFDDTWDILADALQDSFERFAETVPTTPVGMAKKIAFADEMRKRHSEFEEVDIFPTLVIAAKRLLRA
jgi:hypothetical protein